MPNVRLPHPVSGGVMLSYTCTAACRHCMYACSPRWDGDWMTEADLAALLSRLAPHVRAAPGGAGAVALNHGVHFTGGEPFLNFDRLLRAVEIAEALDIPSTFVETNAFWAARDAATRDKLRRLKAAGLKGLMISVNPFYAEYVPFAHTARCVRLAREVFGRNVMVYQQAYYRLFRRLGLEDRIAFDAYRDLTRRLHLHHRVELFLMGRAARALREMYPTYPAWRFFDEPCRPSFLRAWHNHFDNYGNLMPGYCGGVALGDWHDLDALTSQGVDLDAHPVLGYLIAEDVQGLLDFAVARGYAAREDGYVSKCDLCLDLRAYLVTVDAFPELAPRAFYTQLAEEAAEGGA